jgi:hypothetical protein
MPNKKEEGEIKEEEMEKVYSSNKIKSKQKKNKILKRSIN